MGYVSTGMGDRLSALLVSLMVLQLALVDRYPFQPCFFWGHKWRSHHSNGRMFILRATKLPHKPQGDSGNCFLHLYEKYFYNICAH